MKRILFIPLVCLLVLTSALVSCEEVQEAGVYDNWQVRNEHFIDSISSLLRPNGYVSNMEDVDAVPVGEIFAIQTIASTDVGLQYVYCKKLVANPSGERPLYTNHVSVFYYGTLITGASFDGNFTGYSATDEIDLTQPLREPTPFDQASSYLVSGTVSGWIAALQMMRTGERWMIYIPYRSAYGTSDSGDIPAYSALTFDIILNEIEY